MEGRDLKLKSTRCAAVSGGLCRSECERCASGKCQPYTLQGQCWNPGLQGRGPAGVSVFQGTKRISAGQVAGSRLPASSENAADGASSPQRYAIKDSLFPAFKATLKFC